MRGSPWRRPRPRPAGSPTTGSPGCRADRGPRAAPAAAALPRADHRRVPPRGRGLRRRQPAVVRPGLRRRTRWDGPIAPPPLVGGDTLIGEDEVHRGRPRAPRPHEGRPAARRARLLLGQRPRVVGAAAARRARVARRNALVGVLDKASEFAERAVHEWTGQVFRDDDGPLLSAQYRLMIRTERTKAREAQEVRRRRARRPTPTSRSPRSRPSTPAEGPRGAEPRWWEDVAEGDAVGPMVKGPLTVTDMVCWHVGHGHGPLRREAAAARGRATGGGSPASSTATTQNVPDVMQRVHWDPEFARRSGNPTTFDYGRMRETWLIHLCTDWMGDDAWLWKLDCEFRRFNYVGDTQWLRGTVTRRVPGRGRPPGGRPRPRGREPAGRGDHAGPRHDPAAQPRARRRCGCPTRRAAPPTCPAPSTPSPPRSPTARPGPTDERRRTVRSTGWQVDARRRGAPPGARPARQAQRPRRHDGGRARSTPSTPAGRDERGARASCSPARATTSAAAPTSWPATPRRRRAADGPAAPGGSIQRRVPSQAHRLIPLVLGVQVPVVCRVQGWAAGIGLQLAVAADFAVAADDARLWEPFTERGFTPDSGGHVAAAPAGRRPCGPASCCCSAASCRARRPPTGAWSTAPCRRRRSTTRWTRSSSAWPAGPPSPSASPSGCSTPARPQPLEDQLQNEALALELSSRSEDFREGLAAFREKRPPRFTGR